MGYHVNTFDVDVKVKDLPFEFVEELQQDGFHFDVLDEGTYLTYIGGKWSYIENDLLRLAPHVVEPGVIYFQGEDNDQWKVVYDNHTIYYYEARVVYDEHPQVQMEY